MDRRIAHSAFWPAVYVHRDSSMMPHLCLDFKPGSWARDGISGEGAKEEVLTTKDTRARRKERGRQGIKSPLGVAHQGWENHRAFTSFASIADIQRLQATGSDLIRRPPHVDGRSLGKSTQISGLSPHPLPLSQKERENVLGFSPKERGEMFWDRPLGKDARAAFNDKQTLFTDKGYQFD